MAEIRSRDKIERYISVDTGVLERFEREGRRQGEKDLPQLTHPSNKERDRRAQHRDTTLEHLQSEVTAAKGRCESEVKKITQQISVVLPSKEVGEESCDAELEKSRLKLGRLSFFQRLTMLIRYRQI